MKDYDVVILGAGQAGIPLARRLADEGRRVAIVERKHLGGSCVNFGCTPSKAVIASARVAHFARRAAEYGVELPSVRVDYPKVLGRARAIVADSKKGLAEGLRAHAVDVINGHGRFAEREGDRFRISVSRDANKDDVLIATNVVLDTGTRTELPPIKGLADVPYLHAGNWLDHDTLPEHVAFVGGGYIALEMAQFYRRMGSRVTVIGSADQVAPHEDADVAAAIQSLLEAEGVAFHLSGRVNAVERTAFGGVLLTFSTTKGEQSLDASHLFIAAGRRPNTGELGLDTIGVVPGKDGVIKVDDRLATNVAGVWACGDIRGGPMFTHSSWDDHRVLESQLLEDGTRTTANRIVPYAIFTDPELGRVGLTEREARAKYGDRVMVARFEMAHNGKATQIGEPSGFIKLIAHADTHELLGAAVLASEGAELVGSYITLMNARATLHAICGGIYIHPTLTEAVQSAVMALELGRDCS